MVGIYNCGWFGGAIPAAAVTFGTNYISSNMVRVARFKLCCSEACADRG